MTTTLPNPFEFNPAETAADTAVASTDLLPPGGATAVTYQPEPFLDYARRRSMLIVSPPRETLGHVDDEWPRGFDPHRFMEVIEPPPIFLQRRPHREAMDRKPHPALLQALFDLAGPER